MRQQTSRRFVILALSIAALFILWNFAQEKLTDMGDLSEANTGGYVAALEVKNGKRRAVVFNANGDKTEIPDANDSNDLSVAWRSDGNRLMVVSDRMPKNSADAKVYRVHRWNTSDNSVELRLPGKRNVGKIWYPFDTLENAKGRALVIVGGLVNEFDQRTGALTQVVPPPSGGPVRTGEEGVGGMGGALSGVYESIGESFDQAVYTNAADAVISVMKREGGEVLVYSSLRQNESGQYPPPMPIFAGKNIEIQMARNGDCLVTIQGFEWFDRSGETVPDEFKKDGKLIIPFKNGLMHMSISNDQPTPQVISAFPDDQAFGDASVSPQSDKIVTTVGTFTNGRYVPTALVTMPFKPGGGSEGEPIIQGPVRFPTWAPSGEVIVFVGRDSEQNIRMMKLDLVGKKMEPFGPIGEFEYPTFSPKL